MKHPPSTEHQGIHIPAFIDTVRDINLYAIFVLDRDGYIVSWNKGAEQISGWSSEEIIGKHFTTMFDGDEKRRELAVANFKEALKKGEFQEEAVYRDVDGQEYLADYVMTAIYEKQQLQGFVVISKDTTQRKKEETAQIDANTLLRQEIDRRKTIEKALKESNDELDAFASAAGHDLQEPLRMVVSYLQLIEKRYAKSFDQDGLDFLAYAIDGANRMKMLISDLVEYSRIDTLGKPFKITNANAVLKNVLESMEVLINEKGAIVTHDQLPEIWSDEVQLNELFQNLLVNAIRFGSKGSKKQLKVHVGVSKKPTEFVFSVSDNGPGIDKKNFKTIFLIFKQLGNKLQLEGNGVGLAICKKIVKRHKGQIWVESELGKGATFKFSIPRKEKHD